MDPKIGGEINTTPKGTDVAIRAMQGTDKTNVIGGAFGSAHQGVKGGQEIKAMGAFVGANVNGHGVSVEHVKIPNVGNMTRETARVNVFDSGANKIDLSANHSRIQTPQLKFDSIGANAMLSNSKGHSIGAGVSHIPKFDMTTMNVTGTARLAEFGQGNTLNLTSEASRHLSGPFAGTNNFGGSLGLRFPF